MASGQSTSLPKEPLGVPLAESGLTAWLFSHLWSDATADIVPALRVCRVEESCHRQSTISQAHCYQELDLWTEIGCWGYCGGYGLLMKYPAGGSWERHDRFHIKEL